LRIALAFCRDEVGFLEADRHGIPWARAIGARNAAFDATLPSRRGSPQLGMLLHQMPRRLTLLEERWHNPPVEHIFHKCVAPAQVQVTFLVLAFANAFGRNLIASRARSVVRNKRAISACNRVGGSLLISAGPATAAIRGAQN
jgi:hypothetical protein